MIRPTPSSANRQETLDGIVFDSLRPVASILSGVFFLFALVDLLVWGPDGFWLQFGSNVVLGCLLLVGALAFKRWHPAVRWSHPIAMALAGCVWIRVATHMFSAPPDYSVANMSLYILTAGCFLLSNRWFSVLVSVALGSWLLHAVRHGFPEHYAQNVYPLIGAAIMAYVVMNVRIASYLKFHALRREDEKLRRRLARALELLKAREELMREVADTAPVMIGTIDNKGRFTYVNRGWLEFVGSTEDDQLGYDWFNTVHPADRRRWLRTYRQAVKSGHEFKIELRIRQPAGGYRWVVGHARPWRAPNSQADGFIVSAIDIDDRKLAEQQLRESEARLQQILDNTSSVIFIKDLEGRYITVNRQYEQLYHVSRDDIRGMTDYDLFSREVADKLLANDRRVIETGNLLEAEETVPHDGEPHIYLAVKFLLRDATGDPYAVCGIALDITARKLAERALRESEARFRRLFEANIIGVLFTDNAGNVTHANDAFLELTGHARSNLPIPWRDFSPSHGGDKDALVAERLVRDGHVDPSELDMLRADGTTVPVLLGGALLAQRDCVAFVLDLSEHRAADEQIRRLNVELQHASRLSMMGEMAAGLAHEVHQPLGVISNYANGCSLRLSRDRISREELRACMQKISNEAVRAGTILKRIRAFIQKREIQKRSADLNTIIQEALQLAKLDSRRGNVDIRFEPKDLPAVTMDSIQITQVVLNLVLNGIEAMAEHPGRRELTIEARESREDAETIEVVVSDTGPGLSPELQDRIFDQFFTTKEGGLGMGLAISRSIVEAHNGRLQVTTNASGGCTFRFTLPVAVFAEPVPADAESLS